MNEATANAIYDVLVEECGAPNHPDCRGAFVQSQMNETIREYRFQGNLLFGGKFWRNESARPSRRDMWYVNYYREDQSPERDVMQEAANKRLAMLLYELPTTLKGRGLLSNQ